MEREETGMESANETKLTKVAQGWLVEVNGKVLGRVFKTPGGSGYSIRVYLDGPRETRSGGQADTREQAIDALKFRANTEG
jgi:hypothetical protein